MEAKIFVTETDSTALKLAAYRSVAIIFIVMTALCCLGFFISWQTFVFFEIITLISCGVTLLRKRYNYFLRFEADRLFVTNKTTGESFEVYDVPASDFVINQTKSEKKNNHCSLMIKSTSLMFGGLKKCSEMKEYISKNFR